MKALFSHRLPVIAAAAAVSIVPPNIAQAAETVLLTQGAAVEVLVPSTGDGSDALAPADWTGVAAPPATTASTPNGESIDWLTGVTGVGYERTGTNFANAGVINFDVESILDGVNQSLYMRIPFHVDGAALPNVLQMTVRMKYDDGFVAYLNGTPVMTVNAPASLAWDSGASGTHGDNDAIIFEDFDITDHVDLLVAGDNMLAIHALNRGLTSSDFLMLPELVVNDTPPPPPLVWPDYVSTLFSSGFNSPTDIQNAGDGTNRLFVVERPGTIRIVNPNGSLLPQDFLDISGRVTSGSGGAEYGFLGIAFPPDYASKGEFYVSYTRGSSSTPQSVISRFKLDPADASGNSADASTEEILLTANQPFSNHNGGQIRFGPDGFLYIGFGDGGSGGDPGNRAQNPNELLGKMLRIDVDGVKNGYNIPGDNPFAGVAGIRDEIWALGLRNPWRWSFDRLTGDMWIADVGQNAFEEVSKVDAGNNSGLNFGWKRFEGLNVFSSGTALSSFGTEVKPIFDISQSLTGDRSITGGFVYRGSLWPRMQGIYFFADYRSGRELGAQMNSEGEWQLLPFQDLDRDISTWGEDEAGELYYADISTGQMYKISDTRMADFLNVTAAGINGSGRLEFTVVVENGGQYQLQSTTDLQTWIDVGAPVTALGTSRTFTDPDTASSGRKFLRVMEVE